MFWKITLCLKKFKIDRSKNCLGFHKLHFSTLWVEKEGYMTIIKKGHWQVNLKISGTIKLQFCCLHAALQFSGLSIGCLWTSDRVIILLPPAHMKCLLNCHFPAGGFWFFFFFFWLREIVSKGTSRNTSLFKNVNFTIVRCIFLWCMHISF